MGDRGITVLSFVVVTCALFWVYTDARGSEAIQLGSNMLGRSLLTDVPDAIKDDLANDVEFAYLGLFDDSACTESPIDYAYAIGVCHEDYIMPVKVSDTELRLDSYPASSGCTGVVSASTTYTDSCDGNRYRLYGISTAKPWDQSLTTQSVKSASLRFTDTTCGVREKYYFIPIPYTCGDPIAGHLLEATVVEAEQGYRTTTYSDSTCSTATSDIYYKMWECTVTSLGTTSAIAITGDVGTGEILATTITSVAATSVAAAVTTSVVTGSVSGTTGVGGGAAGGAQAGQATGTTGPSGQSSSSAGPILELFHAMQMVSVIHSLGFLSTGGVGAMAKNLAWANVYFDPPFAVEESTVSSSRRLFFTSNLANPNASNSSSQFIGNLFWIAVIGAMLLFVHLLVIGCHTAAKYAIAKSFKRQPARTPGWILFPKWEMVFLLVIFPGLALSSAQAVRSFDHRVSYVAILVLLVLPSIPLCLLGIVCFGSRKKVSYSKIPDRWLVVHPKEGLQVLKESLLHPRIFLGRCKPGGWSRFHETAPVTGQWRGDGEEGSRWLQRWDFAISDYTRLCRYFIVYDLVGKYLRALVIGLLVGFGGSAYLSWALVFLWNIMEFLLRLSLRIKNKKMSQTLAAGSSFFFTCAIGISGLQTSSDGVVLFPEVSSGKLDAALMSFVFIAIAIRIVEVLIQPLGIFLAAIPLVVRPVAEVILSSRSKGGAPNKKTDAHADMCAVPSEEGVPSITMSVDLDSSDCVSRESCEEDDTRPLSKPARTTSPVSYTGKTGLVTSCFGGAFSPKSSSTDDGEDFV